MWWDHIDELIINEELFSDSVTQGFVVKEWYHCTSSGGILFYSYMRYIYPRGIVAM